MLQLRLRMLLLSRLYSQQNKCQEVMIIKRFNQTELDQFTKLTGDFNPIHSIKTPPEKRMVHGALLNGIVAGIIGTRLPGPGTVVLEQKFSFPAPCRIDTDTEIVVRLLKKRKISLVTYECRQGTELVLEGEAKLLTVEK